MLQSFSSRDARPFRAELVAALAVAALLAACGERQQGGAPPPPAVTVAQPVKRTVVDYDEYVGRFVAVNSVEIRARVSGSLEQIHFKDGQMVKQGDLLFTIDKRPFQNTLDQARANLSQAKSNLSFTESDYQRAQQLVRDKTITDQIFEQRAQAFRNAQASVAAGEAAVRQAELDHGIHRAQGACCRPYRRPPRLAGQSGDGRQWQRHDAARHHRLDRSDPLRIHLR